MRLVAKVANPLRAPRAKPLRSFALRALGAAVGLSPGAQEEPFAALPGADGEIGTRFDEQHGYGTEKTGPPIAPKDGEEPTIGETLPPNDLELASALDPRSKRPQSLPRGPLQVDYASARRAMRKGIAYCYLMVRGGVVPLP